MKFISTIMASAGITIMLWYIPVKLAIGIIMLVFGVAIRVFLEGKSYYEN